MLVGLATVHNLSLTSRHGLVLKLEMALRATGYISSCAHFVDVIFIIHE